VKKEVVKLLARPDYFSKMPEDLVEIAAFLHDRAKGYAKNSFSTWGCMFRLRST
jgi:hypothetical protein